MLALTYCISFLGEAQAVKIRVETSACWVHVGTFFGCFSHFWRFCMKITHSGGNHNKNWGFQAWRHTKICLKSALGTCRGLVLACLGWSWTCLGRILACFRLPCSAAVRAQHIRRLPKGEPCVPDINHSSSLYLPLRHAFRIKLQIPSSKAFPHPFVPSPGPAHTAQPAQKLREIPLWGLKTRFFSLPKIILIFASNFFKNWENPGF